MYDLMIRYRFLVPANFYNKGDSEKVETVTCTLNEIENGNVWQLGHSNLKQLSRDYSTGIISSGPKQIHIFENDIVETNHNFGSVFGAVAHTGVVVYSLSGWNLRHGPIGIELGALRRNHWLMRVVGTQHDMPDWRERFQ